MRLFAVALFCCLAVVTEASMGPAIPPSPVTAKEIAQGYRDGQLLALPRQARRAALEREENLAGVAVRETFARLGDLRVVEPAAGENVSAAIARLQATGLYEFVEPDYVRHVAAVPNESRFSDGSLWALNNTGLSNGVVGADIKAAAAWDIIREAPSVVVAVVDTGVNLTHQDLAANLWTNPSPTFGDLHGASFASGGTSGTPNDENGHGTHVAGTIGAVADNGVGIAGIAWRVQIMAVKVFPASGSGSVRDIVRGVQYAVEHGAHIINASYGEASTGFSQTELTAITAARDAGIIFVAAAGNDGANMDTARFYPASHALDNIVSVGNSTRRDELSPSSNYGAAVDLFAPGTEIVSLSSTSDTGTATLSGTSMAAPHVSGALALLKARFPGEGYRSLINRLLRGVDRGDRFTGKAQTGGRLNLLGALTTATNRPFNDDFAERPRLNSSTVSIRASNFGATVEPGEPGHAGAAASGSLWWEWKAPTSGTVSVDTAGSAYDTLLAVYSGSTPSALTAIAANDDSASGVQSRVTFSAEAGSTYQIAVAGKNGASGLTLLKLGTSPTNDLFAAATALTGISARATGTNSQCSREPGEPLILGRPGGLSLWYRWTAPRNGRVQVSAVSRDFDPILAVYTGTALTALSLVAENDNASPTAVHTGSLCTFEAVAGVTYAIAVDSKFATEAGQFTLSLTDSLWQVATDDAVTGTVAVGGDGTLCFGSTDGAIYALGADGAKKWSFPTNSFIDTSSPAIADDGTAYVGSNDGRFLALTPSGTAKWTRSFGASASNSAAVAGDGTIYVKIGDSFLYALNPADGSTKWRYDIGARESYASPSIAPDGTVYIGSENRVLYALNPNGTLKWSFTSGNEIYTVPAIDAAGNLYFGILSSGRLYSLSPSGTQRWVYSGASLGTSSSPALSPDGNTAYYGGYDGKLHAVNTGTGAARWTYTLGDEVRASSPAVDANGTIYLGCYDGRLYAINPDGTLKRTWDTGDAIRSSPAIHGTRLYLGSNDGKVYAFDIGAGAGGGPWPQYRHNVRHLGRAIASRGITQQPVSQVVAPGGNVTFSVAATGSPAPTYQWQRNGIDIPGATGASIAVANVQPSDIGLYTVTISDASGTTVSQPAILAVATGGKVTGSGREVLSDAVVAGRTFDQILLEGAAVTVKADPGQILRLSFIDLSHDIVQVEFSGAGSVSVLLDNLSGPAAPQNYNQPGVLYRRGHAGIVVAGADATTNLLVFSVGRVNALTPGLIRDEVSYDGFADLSFIAISSTDGKFGFLRTANVSYLATRGLTGVYAPGVQFTGPVYVYNINAAETATPVLLLGGSVEVAITGGDLTQDNNRAVQISGITQLRFDAGQSSAGTLLPARAIRGRLERDGVDVTSSVARLAP